MNNPLKPRIPTAGSVWRRLGGVKNRPRSEIPDVAILRRIKLIGELSEDHLADIETRSGRAYDELKLAHHFDNVLANHDGEDSDNWEAFPCPVGDARRTMVAVADLLAGRRSSAAEVWDKDLLSDG